MRMTRRTLLIGAGAGALSVLLASCFPEPDPSPTQTSSPSPTPSGDGPQPIATLRSAWSTDSFAYGAASFTPVGAQPTSREALAESVEDRVFFAGEATDTEEPGTMQGAIRSGERAADELRRHAAAGERIAVVGAGLAGATAAAELVGAGGEVTVFEARERVGGRIQSHVDDAAWPFPVQLGGWLLAAEDEDLREGVDSLDIRTVDLVTPGWRSAEGDVDPADGEVIRNAADVARTQPADVSLSEALSEAGADLDDPSLGALLAALAAMSGADAEEISGWFPTRLPSDSYSAPLADLGALIEEGLDGARVSLSSPVSRVAYDDTGVSLGLGTGESLSFDRVLVTVPLGVLKEGGVEFDPALPLSHRGAVTALRMGHIETIWLRFEEPFWDTEATLWHVVGGEHRIRTWFNLLPDTGESVLVGVVGGAAAEEFAGLGDDEAVTAALEALEPFRASEA